MIYLLLNILIFARVGEAQSPAYDWNEIRAAAVGQNAELGSAQKSWQSSRAGEKAAYGAFLPAIALNARRDRTNTEVSTFETQSRTRQYSVAASWNIFNGFATFANVRKAGAQADETLAARDVTSAELRYQLRRAFFAVYVQQARIELFERTLKRQEQNEKLVSLKHDSGIEALWNVMRAKAERERAAFNLQTAKDELLLARDKLASYLQVDSLPERPVEIPPTDSLLDARNLPAVESIRQHPSAVRSRAYAEKIGQDITLARAAFLPALDLAYSRGRETSEIGARPRTDSNTFAIVAQWQIFNGLSDFHKVQQASLARDAAELDRVKTERELQTAIRSAAINLRTARAGLPSAKSLRVAAEERVRTVSAQYRSGLKNYLEWEEAETQLNEFEEAEISTLSDALNALAEYERANGITMEQP